MSFSIWVKTGWDAFTKRDKLLHSKITGLIKNKTPTDQESGKISCWSCFHEILESLSENAWNLFHLWLKWYQGYFKWTRFSDFTIHRIPLKYAKQYTFKWTTFIKDIGFWPIWTKSFSYAEYVQKKWINSDIYLWTSIRTSCI